MHYCRALRNHNGSIERAESILRAAADAGADAVKLQTYTADTLTIPCDNEYFRIKGTIWEGRTLHDLYQEAHTPWEWTPRLMALAKDLGMDCFSTPFDATAVDFLEGCGVSRYKVASFEVVDIPLLKKIAATGKPVIMSTGMATLAEIDEAVRTLRDNGTTDLTLLKCTSAYPAPPEEANLRTIPHMAQAFGCNAGLSDHTMGSAVAVAAVALGATVIEKHFTLSRADGGPDGSFSMEPYEFKQMVQDIRTTEKALGSVCYDLTEKQKKAKYSAAHYLWLKTSRPVKNSPQRMCGAFGLDMGFPQNICRWYWDVWPNATSLRVRRLVCLAYKITLPL